MAYGGQITTSLSLPYDVSQDDPELMGSYRQKNHADFHEQYLKAIFRAKNISYTKKNPGDAQKEYYLKELIKRIRDRLR